MKNLTETKTSQKKSDAGFVARMALISSLTALSIDMMLPAYPDIASSLQITNANNLQLLITLFMFGMFLGELLVGPLSDAFGRKRILVCSIAVYCLGTLAAIAANSIEVLLLGRIVQGVGVSGPKIISRAMVRDQFEGRRMARIMSFVITLFVFIPMVAPALGQAILVVASWRGIFVFFLMVALLSTTWLMIRQPETLPVEKRKPFKVGILMQNTLYILSNRMVMLYTVTAGLVFGVFLLYLSTSQMMFEKIYAKSSSFVLYYAILATGFGLAALLNSKFVLRFGMYRLAVIGNLGLIAIGLFFLATSTEGVPPFIPFMMGCYCFMFCVGLLFPNLAALAMQPLGHIAGLGASIISSVSTLLAVFLSTGVGRFYNNTLHPLILILLVAGLFSLILLYSTQRNSSIGIAGDQNERKVC